MKLKKEFADFYREIRIDKETNALREKREILEEDIKSKLPDILKDQNISVNRSDIRMIDQGSYKYNTTISDDVVDRDVAVMIPLDISVSSYPRKIKGYLRDTINIPSRTVSIKEPCVISVPWVIRKVASVRSIPLPIPSIRICTKRWWQRVPRILI